MKEITEMEKALARIKSVLGAKIVTNAKGEIVEVHVLATDERNPKQVVRDVESTLLVKFSQKVDHKKIGVVQESGARSQSEGRLRFLGISSVPGRQNLLEVSLRDPEGLEHIGQSIIDDPAQRLAGLAQATLEAVNHYLKEEHFILQGIHRLQTPELTILVSSVAYSAPSGPQILSGSALVKGSEEEAAVKSTLSAINRLLPRIAKTIPS